MNDDVKLLLFDVRALPNSETARERLAKRLTPERRRKVERFRFEADKKRALVAGLALDYAFGERATEIYVDAFGKPRLPNGVGFNLSHSGAWVVLALDSRGEVGCDVQTRQATLKPQIIAKSFFHPQEYAAFQNAPPDEQERAFYRIWTLKESYLKALGRGFRVAPTSCAIALSNPPRLSMRAQEDDARDWNFRVWNFEDATLASCSTAPFEGEPQVVALFRRDDDVKDS